MHIFIIIKYLPLYSQQTYHSKNLLQQVAHSTNNHHKFFPLLHPIYVQMNAKKLVGLLHYQFLAVAKSNLFQMVYLSPKGLHLLWQLLYYQQVLDYKYIYKLYLTLIMEKSMVFFKPDAFCYFVWCGLPRLGFNCFSIRKRDRYRF